MTSLSQYLRAERADTSEPAAFYMPGADEWGGAKQKLLWSRRTKAPPESLYLSVTEQTIVVEELKQH